MRRTIERLARPPGSASRPAPAPLLAAPRLLARRPRSPGARCAPAALRSPERTATARPRTEETDAEASRAAGGRSSACSQPSRRSSPPRARPRTPSQPARRAREADSSCSRSPSRPRRRTRRRPRSSSRRRRVLDRLVRALARAGSATLQQTGSGEEAVITKVTWSGGKVPTGEDARLPVPRRAETRARPTRSASGRPTRTGRSSTGPGRSPPTTRRRRSRRSRRSAAAGTLDAAIVALVLGALGSCSSRRRARRPAGGASSREAARARLVPWSRSAALALPAARLGARGAAAHDAGRRAAS